MLIREFNLKYNKKYPEIVLYAGEYLERLGFIFLIDFGWENAIDKAAKGCTGWLDEENPNWDWKEFRNVSRDFGEWVEYH